MITVNVTVGVGMWKASTTVELIAAPHTGDRIVVYGTTITCDIVSIDKDMIYVEQKYRFSSEEQAKQLQAEWDE